MAKAKSVVEETQIVEEAPIVKQTIWQGHPSRDTKTPIPGYNATTGEYEVTEQPIEEVPAAVLDGE